MELTHNSQEYQLQSSTSLTIEDLMFGGDSTHFILDTSFLRFSFQVLKDLKDSNVEYENVLEKTRNRMHQLVSLIEEKKITVFPSVYEEYTGLEKKFLNLLVRESFENIDDSKYKSELLFDIFNQNNLINQLLEYNINNEIQEEAEKVFSNFSEQLIFSYQKDPRNIKKISYVDQIIYLGSLLYAKESNSCLITRDEDFKFQPAISYKGERLSIPLYFTYVNTKNNEILDNFYFYYHDF